MFITRSLYMHTEFTQIYCTKGNKKQSTDKKHIFLIHVVKGRRHSEGRVRKDEVMPPTLVLKGGVVSADIS